jgi:hypothetical protein
MPASTAPPFAWLPVEACLEWLQLPADLPAEDDRRKVVELVRTAAADHCEAQRPDLAGVTLGEDGTTVTAEWWAAADVEAVPDRYRQAGLLAMARLYARRSSPAGLASYGEFGAAEVLRLDPDVARLLGTGRFATPVVG